MNNGPNDAPTSHRGRGAAQLERGASGMCIPIESDGDGDDNESTTAEHDYLLPTPTTQTPPPLSLVTSGQQITGSGGASTIINLEHFHPPGRSSSVGGSRPNGGNILTSFLARQRSFTPVSSTPLRTTNQVNRRLQQSRSVGAPSNNILEDPPMPPPPPPPASAPSPATMRQLGFWRVNLNEMFSLSTAPSTEALRSFIAHSNFRYQPIAGGAAGAAGATASSGDNPHNLLNQNQMPLNMEPEASTSASILMRSSNSNNNNSTGNSTNNNNSGAMGRSISLREGEMQQPRHSLNTRHNASVLGLTTPAMATIPIAHPEAAAGGGGAGLATPGGGGGAADATTGAASANGNGNGQQDQDENNADDDHIITDMVVHILSHFVRYLPFICILMIKFVHDHLLGILDLLLLLTIMYNVNLSVRQQVARLAQKNYAVLLRDILLVSVVVAVRLFMATTPPDPFGLLIPPPKTYQIIDIHKSGLPARLDDIPPTTFHSSSSRLDEVTTETAIPKAIPLGMLLYYVAVSDMLLKLLTILVKLGITLLPLHVIRLKVRVSNEHYSDIAYYILFKFTLQARLYVLVEYISQFYRALAPITQWGMFLYASYSGLEVISGFLFCTLYVFCKIFELAERGKSLKKAISTFRRNIVSDYND